LPLPHFPNLLLIPPNFWFLNSMCPPKYNYDERFWYDVIDSIEGHAKDYEMGIMEWIPGQPVLPIPRRIPLFFWPPNVTGRACRRVLVEFMMIALFSSNTGLFHLAFTKCTRTCNPMIVPCNQLVWMVIVEDGSNNYEALHLELSPQSTEYNRIP
jgi:hypothetical protein